MEQQEKGLEHLLIGHDRRRIAFISVLPVLRRMQVGEELPRKVCSSRGHGGGTARQTQSSARARVRWRADGSHAADGEVRGRVRRSQSSWCWSGRMLKSNMEIWSWYSFL